MSTDQQDGQSAVVLRLASNEVTVGLSDLEQLKTALLAALRDKNPTDYGWLIEELSEAKCFIAGESAHVGGWQLGVRDGEPVLVRQQMPRAPLMLFHVARLTHDNGRWHVRSLSIEKVKGR